MLKSLDVLFLAGYPGMATMLANVLEIERHQVADYARVDYAITKGEDEIAALEELWLGSNELRRETSVVREPMQPAEAFLPIRFMRVPNKSKFVELLSPSLRQSLAVAPNNNPLPKAKAIFFMSGRNATVTFALLVDRQIAEAFRPVRFVRVPNKSKFVELLSPSLR
jgi:hypothetical protein